MITPRMCGSNGVTHHDLRNNFYYGKNLGVSKKNPKPPKCPKFGKSKENIKILIMRGFMPNAKPT